MWRTTMTTTSLGFLLILLQVAFLLPLGGEAGTADHKYLKGELVELWVNKVRAIARARVHCLWFYSWSARGGTREFRGNDRWCAQFFSLSHHFQTLLLRYCNYYNNTYYYFLT